MNSVNTTGHFDPYNVKRRKIYRLNAWQPFVFWPLAITLHGYLKSLRISYQNKGGPRISESSSPRVLVVWHNRSLVAPEVFRRYFNPRKITCLISPSQMAAWEVAFFETYKLRAIRGSTTRRSIQALRDMLGALRQGYDVGISPDGPSGPLYSFQKGAVLLARRAGVPLVLLSMNAPRARRAKTWDRHMIPWPASRVNVLSKSFPPEHSCWEASDDELRKYFRSELLELTNDPFHLSSE